MIFMLSTCLDSYASNPAQLAEVRVLNQPVFLAVGHSRIADLFGLVPERVIGLPAES